VHAVLAAPSDLTVSDVDLLGAELRQRVVVEWNDTFVPYDRTATIHSLFESQADRTPQTRAVVCNGRSLTYAELDARANQLAHHLVGLGVRPGDLVGVHLERSLGLVVTALAVMKAGAAYVPLDPSYPHDRLVHMVRDSGCAVLVTDSSATDAASMGSADRPITVVQIERDRDAIEQHPQTRPSADVTSEHVAYCIYTSGSTGLPKGVLVEHRNVVNFFTGMDPDVPHELPATWFAVTSLSFDISVLELFYTLTRGFTVVVYVDHDRVAAPGGGSPHAHRPIDFSLFYFSGDASSAPGPERYRLLIEGARYADQHGFRAVWTPERHFHAFGGLYPAPAVTGAAVAAVTENVQIRAGSVVLPLDHPIRVVEAWSVIDNISNGRVGISIASGWQPNDFVLRPENYATAKQAMFDGAETLRRLWRGETVAFDGPLGAPVDVATMPSPVQPELPLWVTTAGNPDTYVQAGRTGANVLTHLLGQSVEQLAPKIEMYRQARAEAGFDPDAGVVSLMLHTYVGHDDDEVRDAVRGPLKEYLGTSFSLLKEYAWSFPAFARPAGSEGDALADADFADLSPDDLDAVLEFAFLRYFESSGLFGTPERCLEMVDRLKAIGVDEIACLVDFGVDTDSVLASLPVLTDIMVAANPAPAEPTASTIEPVEHLSVAEQLDHYEVTHLQCTPSMARMFSLQDDTRGALAKVPNMYVGGEALPVALARDLSAARDGRPLTNMYGPTETTIWSTTWRVPADVERIQIGQPIANTAIYILDTRLQPVLPGVPGDLWIGGDGVVRGYHERPELTAERFVTDPFRGSPHRMYCTGDLARWVQRDDGTAELEFLGRLDHQVKVRGYRIELGEIEAQLGRFPGIRESVVVVREDEPGDQQLVGYLSCTHGSTIEPMAVREHLRVTLPDPMVPSHIVVLDDVPHTPNGKIDRNALPAPGVVKRRRSGEAPVAAASDLEREVLDVWHDVLGHTDIGVDENFFDVGGHSLLVVRMHRRLKERLDRSIALTDLYRFPTVRTFTESLTAEPDDRTVRAGVERAQRRRQRRARA
jgi:natural product biosynthesis luciferase-like monooxygenase protein